MRTQHTTGGTLVILIVASLSLLACGTDEGDTGADADTDAHTGDVSGDVDVDADNDVLADADDAGDTAGGDVNHDADTDGDGDAALPDADVDADATLDSTPSDCEPGAYVGDASWQAELVVEDGALLCAFPAREYNFFGEETQAQALQRSLDEDRAGKSTIWIPAGTYALPTEPADVAFYVPMCVRDATSATTRVPSAASSVFAQRVDDAIGMLLGHHVSADLGLGDETLSMNIVRPLDEPATASLSASAIDEHRMGVTILRDDRLYVSCNLSPRTCTNLEFGDTGTLRVDEYHWQDSPGLGFAQLVRVSGTFGGVAVDVDAYEQLQSIYGHHAFDRYMFVRFDAPIDGACGLRLDNVFGEWAYAPADCDGRPSAEFASVLATVIDCD